jgi:hypothetical protein
VVAKWGHRYRKRGWSLVKILDKNDDEFEHPAETVWGALELAPICILLGCSFANTASKTLRIVLSLKPESSREQLAPLWTTFSFVSPAKYGFDATWRFSPSGQLDGDPTEEHHEFELSISAIANLNSATLTGSNNFQPPEKGRRALPSSFSAKENSTETDPVPTQDPADALVREAGSSSPYTFQSSPPTIRGTPVTAAVPTGDIPRAMPQLQSILKRTASTGKKSDPTSSSTLQPTIAVPGKVPTSTSKRNRHSETKRARSKLTPIHVRGMKRNHPRKPTTLPAEKQVSNPQRGDGSVEEQHNSSPAEAESQDEVELNLELARRQAEMQRMSSEADRARNPIPLTPRKSPRGKRSVAQGDRGLTHF